MQLPRVFLPPIIVFTTLIVGMLLFTLWYQRRSTLRATDPETIQRAIESTDTSQGDQVWFSRQVHRGKWRNWSLIIRNRRYELKQSLNPTTNTPAGPLFFEASPCSLPYERQQAEADRTYLPSYRGFYVCLIGWTRRDHGEICRAADRVVAGLGDDVWEGNVQDFLRGLADRVCEHRKAADWSWFRDNVTSHYGDVEARLMAGPKGAGGWAEGRKDRNRNRSVMQAASVDAGVRAWAYG